MRRWPRLLLRVARAAGAATPESRRACGTGAAAAAPSPRTAAPPAPPAAPALAPARMPARRRQQAPAFLPGAYAVPAPVRVPGHIARPSYADDPNGRPRPLGQEEYAEAKGPETIARMRGACGLAADALALACEVAQEGMTTDAVDRAVCDFVISRGAYPVGINYHGFPRGLCASPNEVALHGIPNTRPLESGDIVNFDVTVFLGGAYGDCSATVCIGDVDASARRLVETTEGCLHGAIAQVGPGVRLNAIGRYCEAFARERGYGIVSEFCGHFIGSELHMRPNVLHVPNGNALELRPGMTFTIEPILVEGGAAEIVGPLEDGWTIVSRTGDWSAQWEHTVLVTQHGAEILTVLGGILSLRLLSAATRQLQAATRQANSGRGPSDLGELRNFLKCAA